MQENCYSFKIRAGEGEVFDWLKLFDEPEPAENRENSKGIFERSAEPSDALNFVQKVLVREGFEDAGPIE